MTIEGNKDEAEKCIQIAQLAIATGNLAKAEKFLAKAERLYPTQQAKDLLARVETLMSQGGGTQNVDSDHSQSEARRRKPATPSAAASQKEYTSEQLAAVRRINIKCKDYYEILGVTKEATDSDIKKSYKRLALQLHPDKNRAPGAAEAFKAIGNAAAVLTDPEKRKAYDLRGEEPAGVAQHHGQHHYYARGFESDLTAEELFNMFFGQAGQRVYTRRHYARETERQQDNTNNFFQLLPVLILVLVSMMSSFFISDPPYNLQRTSKYTVLRETNNLKVPYYVKDNFHTDYQGSLKRLEMSIEEEYLVNLRHACQRERNYKETMAWKARNFGDSRQYQEAQKMRMPSCEKLQSFHR